MKIAKFAQMMGEIGHEVFIYEAGDEPLGFEEDWSGPNLSMASRIAGQRESGDFLCIIGGRAQRAIADALPEMMAIEYGIGYGGVFANFRIFESYAWMHTVYAAGIGDPHALDGRYFDAVIPNYFDLDDFPLGDGGDYLLYVGRLIGRKGVELAGQIAERAELPLILAGEGPEPPSYGECIGPVGSAERAKLMGDAIALLAPTQYLEPFGGVAVESMMCGTPAITTDWGAFPETVRHGVTGFRCRTMGEFLYAVDAAPSLDRAEIRTYARERYSLGAIAPRYERYFERLKTLAGAGFYDETRVSGLPRGA